MLLCAECYDEEVTRAHNASLSTAAPAPSTTDLPIPHEVPVVNTYAMAWTDGGCRDVTVGKKKLSNVGGWAFLLLCGRGEKLVSSCSLGPDSTNNIAEFTAILQVITLAVSEHITQLDIKTDCMLAVQYHENTATKNSDILDALFRDTEDMARRGALQFRLQHVSAHKNDLNNNFVDGLCTEVIKANDMKPRLKRTKIKAFPSPDNCALPRYKPNTAANYQTFPPYAPLYEDVTPPRGVADLSDDRGNVLHICPLCDPSDPKTAEHF